MLTEAMRYFTIVYGCLSFSKAAEKIGISQQGLGKAIRQLEHDFGVDLFIRSNKGIRPTPIAIQIYENIKKMIDINEEILYNIKDYKSKNKIIFAVPAQYQVGYLVKKYIDQYNEEFNTSIECVSANNIRTEDEQEQMLLEGKCDFRILNKIFNRLSNFPTHPLCYIPFIPITGVKNPLSKQKNVTWEDLSNQVIVVEDIGYAYVRQVIETCRANGFEPNIQITSGDLFSINQICTQENAIYFTKKCIFNFIGGLENGNNQLVKLDFVPDFRSEYIIQGRKDKWDKRLVNYLHNCMKDFES